ncbi:hypothetical protein BDW60DRAFT_75451 [Aspergillus nidulans var. acristatus]
MTSGSETLTLSAPKNPPPRKDLETVDNLTSASPYNSARRRDNPSRCRATRVSVPSKSLPKLRSRTVPSLSGFASGLVTPLDTTLSDDTGARPVSVSKLVLSSMTESTHCFPGIFPFNSQL